MKFREGDLVIITTLAGNSYLGFVQEDRGERSLVRLWGNQRGCDSFTRLTNGFTEGVWSIYNINIQYVGGMDEVSGG